MGDRLDLHDIFLEILGSDFVYFQPPPTYQMSYPCIVYQRDDIKSFFANNLLYRFKKRYKVTVIDPDPDSSIPDKILNLATASFDRHFTFDNLNHDIFTLFY